MSRFMLMRLCLGLLAVLLAGGASAQKTETLSVYIQDTLDAKGNSLPPTPGLLKFFKFFERETGLRFEVISLPWNRAKRMTLEGKGIVWSFSKSPERLQNYHYSETVMKSKIWAIAYGEPHQQLRQISDLQGKTVSVERGVSHGMEFENSKGSVFKVDEDSASASARFRKLIAGRCDVLLWGLVQFDRRDLFLDYLHKTYLPSLRDEELLGKSFYASRQPLFYDTLHFASAKGKFIVEMNKIDEAIKHGVKTGELSKLILDFE